jgi:hypothetical protein
MKNCMRKFINGRKHLAYESSQYQEECGENSLDFAEYVSLSGSLPAAISIQVYSIYGADCLA